MTRREALKFLAAGGAAVAGGAALGEEIAAGARRVGLPKGCIGDPKQPWFGQHVFPLPHTIEDGPSCFRKDGKVMRPAAEIPVFHQAAGTAAALAARLGVTPRRLDVKLLQKTLVEQGACFA